MCVWQSVCVCVAVCVRLFVCLSVGLSVCLPVCPSARPPDRLPACCLAVCLSVCLSVFLSVCLSVCLSVARHFQGPRALRFHIILLGFLEFQEVQRPGMNDETDQTPERGIGSLLFFASSLLLRPVKAPF